ncbi:probable ATP-dependent RNA helicase DDX27 isoform X2 [Hydractinia symbiolongicarpus]|uniref:probable ATP-dependent RNA helicase DDX27 isoform X2 n=1 Tax=Hydractinia symbiolongicarpus TaxID=13093 RepID=UPI00254C3A61|nr:probable ATP-dependent RNA helicase DDX27 isoform X2 [Hydractinia symbiolongicarpus]
MADFLHGTKTINSDEELSLDDEEEVEKEESHMKGKKKKKTKIPSDFNNEFNMVFEKSDGSDMWRIHGDIKSKAKGLVSSEILEEKIKAKRRERKINTLKENKDSENNEHEKESVVKKENEEIQESDDEDDVDFSESENESEPERENGDFFEQAPKQVKHESFVQMNLSRPLLKALNTLGFLHPTPIQLSTIPLALLGKDICACATTGSGKTAAFMLPILERLLFKPKQSSVSRVLVLVPTRELAIQVHSVSLSLAKHTNVQICIATGGLDSKTQEANLRKSPDIIIATPGRLIDHLHNAPSFDLQTIEILVLDEADRMLEEHFKDQMKELIRLCPRGRQTMLFSATMTDEVEELASLSLNRPVKLFVDHNTDVAKSLHQEFVRIRENREADRLAIVTALCCRSFNDHTLIFLQTKRLAHRLRIILGLFGLKAAELHGDLTQLQRIEALEKYKNNDVDILVATDLAARGLDIAGVKTVISYNMPTTIKSYIHRVGRTARAGKVGKSITLVGEKERKMLKEVVKNAHVPVKNRIISQEVVLKYKQKLEELEKDIKDLLKQEEEEKELRIAEMQATRAHNLIVHRDKILSRPARTFIKTTKDKNTKEKKSKNSVISAEDRKIAKEQEFQKRTMKRERKPKRIRACDENDNPKTKTKDIVDGETRRLLS